MRATKGVYGSYNDKTIVRFDEFICAIKGGKYESFVFKVYDESGNTHNISGVWMLTTDIINGNVCNAHLSTR
jgi:hypothetical protein